MRQYKRAETQFRLTVVKLVGGKWVGSKSRTLAPSTPQDRDATPEALLERAVASIEADSGV